MNTAHMYNILHYMYMRYITCTYATLHVHMLHYMYICHITCTYATLHVHMLHYMYITTISTYIPDHSSIDRIIIRHTI